MNELTQLVDDIGRRSFDARLGHRGVPDEFDAALWRHLEETGLARLTSSQAAGPAEAAIVLSGLARHAGAVPIAETDLLAAWLAGEAAVDVPDSGPLTVAVADAQTTDGRIVGAAAEVAWPHSASVLLAARTADGLHVTVVDDLRVVDGHNLAGEPRGSFAFDVPVDRFASVRLSAGRRTRPPRRVGPLRADRRCAGCRRGSHRRPYPRAPAVRQAAVRIPGGAAFVGGDGGGDRTGPCRNDVGDRRGRPTTDSTAPRPTMR